jgi:dTDP-4-amino-4,6-dideoxygalactose transaminase
VLNERVPFTDLAAMTRDVRAAVEKAWANVLDSSRFVGGEEVEKFEQNWASYCDVPHAVGVGNGTDALQLTLMALNIGVGDEVIVPANTFVATAEAVVLAGATPVFADVSPDTLLLTSAQLEAAITPRTAAVIVVHLYGQLPDMDALTSSAKRAGIVLIEDAAQAHGARWRGRPAGSMGRAGCFSFYPAKNLGAFGDGGAVVTADTELADRIASMREHGRSPGSHYDHKLVGTNSRLDDMQAAVLNAKLPWLDAWTEARRSITARYRAALDVGACRPVAEEPGSLGAYHLAVVRIPDRTRVQRELAEAGIETQIHYPVPCHRQVPYQHFARTPLPVAEENAGEILSLPMFPHMSDHLVTRVCDAISVSLGAREPCRVDDTQLAARAATPENVGDPRQSGVTCVTGAASHSSRAQLPGLPAQRSHGTKKEFREL